MTKPTDTERIEQVHFMFIEKGMTVRQIGRELGINAGMVSRDLKGVEKEETPKNIFNGALDWKENQCRYLDHKNEACFEDKQKGSYCLYHASKCFVSSAMYEKQNNNPSAFAIKKRKNL